MKKKWVLLFLLMAFFSVAVWNLQRWQRPRWIRLPVTISAESGQPFVEVEIQGLKLPVMVDLGSPTSLVLAEEIIEKIKEKTPYQGRSLIAMNGQTYFLEGYIVSNVRLRNLSIGKLEVSKGPEGFLGESGLLWNGSPEEEAEKRFGELGFGFFEMLKMPLFLDMSQLKIYIDANFRHLLKEGYKFKDWIKIPFELSSCGIILDVKIDQESKKLVLDTGATYNILAHPFIEEDALFYTPAHFQIGNKNFGEQKFLLYPFPDAFKKIDGFLGMNFLKNHFVYLDFTRRIAYIAPILQEVLETVP